LAKTHRHGRQPTAASSSDNKYGNCHKKLVASEMLRSRWFMANTMTDNEDVATILHAMDEGFMRNVAAKDAKQLTKDFYAEDAQLLPPHQDPVVGQPAIEQAFETLIAGGLRDLILQTNKVEASGDLAYGVGTYKMTIPIAAGAEIHDEGKYVVVYRRQQAGTWRAVADIFNSSLPAPSSNA
jgi:ketosteroid isomerase-like protein